MSEVVEAFKIFASCLRDSDVDVAVQNTIDALESESDRPAEAWCKHGRRVEACALCSLDMSRPAPSSTCSWDDCDQEALYCEGHARELVVDEVRTAQARVQCLEAFDIPRLRAEVERLRRVEAKAREIAQSSTHSDEAVCCRCLVDAILAAGDEP